MTKSELRKARKAAASQGGDWRSANTGEHRDDRRDAVCFSETPRGYRARERWARRYADLNGAPESLDDR